MDSQAEKTEAQDLKSALDNLKAAVKAATPGDEDKTDRALTEDVIEEIIGIQEELMFLFTKYGSTLTPAERARLISGGIKNYGFIQVAYNSAIGHHALVPGYLILKKFHDAITDIDYKRTLLSLVKQFAQNISDGLLVDSDFAYHYALEYYNYVKEAARQRVPGAEIEYNLLKPYFKKSKPAAGDDEPTEEQIERDVHGLLHGTKDGKIVIENEHPEVSGGKHVVSDAVYSDHAEVKETIQAKTNE